jgi:hypothetical protein
MASCTGSCSAEGVSARSWFVGARLAVWSAPAMSDNTEEKERGQHGEFSAMRLARPC